MAETRVAGACHKLVLMVRIWLIALLASTAAFGGVEEFNGRWDITVPGEARSRAWWLEVTGAETPAPVVKFVGAPGGQMDTIRDVSVKDGVLTYRFVRKARDDQREWRGEWRARLEMGRARLLEVLPRLEDVARIELRIGEVWSPRKMLRRSIWHERDHTQHILQFRARLSV